MFNEYFPKSGVPRNTLAKGMEFAMKNGIKTFDPNDIKGSKLILWTYKKGFAPLLLKYSLLGTDLFFPRLTRKCLRIKKQTTAGGVSLLASACCSYYQLTKKKKWLNEANNLLNWLSNNSIKTKNGEAWGFPFDWKSLCIIPKNSPIGHTTMTCTNAFLNYYLITKEKWVEKHIISSCNFFLNDLNITNRDSGSIALSYTQFDKSQVINTNADIGAVLLKAGNLFNKKYYSNFAHKIGHFVIENQNFDGSWGYFAKDSIDGVNKIDNYHTGMVLAALYEYQQETENQDLTSQYRESLIIGIDYFLNNLFFDSGAPIFTASKPYPIDAYSCGQSIYTLSKLLNYTPKFNKKMLDLVDKVVYYVINNMQNKDGSFITKKYKYINYNIKSLRWAQAMICLGLANYLKIDRSIAN